MSKHKAIGVKPMALLLSKTTTSFTCGKEKAEAFIIVKKTSFGIM